MPKVTIRQWLLLVLYGWMRVIQSYKTWARTMSYSTWSNSQLFNSLNTNSSLTAISILHRHTWVYTSFSDYRPIYLCPMTGLRWYVDTEVDDDHEYYTLV